MEKRSLIAFLLIGFMLFILMQRLQQRQEAARQQEIDNLLEPAQTPDAPDAPDAASPAATEAPDTAPVEPVVAPAQQVPLQDNIVMKGDDLLYNLVWTNRGAALRSGRLTRYAQKLDAEEGVEVLAEVPGKIASLAVIDPTGAHPFDTRNYEVERKNDGALTFTARFPDNLELVKEFTPRPDTNELGVRITATNRNASGDPIFAKYEIVAAGRVRPGDNSTVLLKGACGYASGKGSISIDRGQPATGKSWIGDNKMPFNRASNEAERIVWAGASSRYFAAILQSEESTAVQGGARETIAAADVIAAVRMDLLQNSDSVFTWRGAEKRLDNLYVAVAPKAQKLAPGESVTYNFTYFIGPKKQELLDQYAFKDLQDYGWFGAVSKVLLWMLNLFHKLIPNYGVCIVLLTLLVKVVLHPFAKKAQVSIFRMQKLQPLIKQLQEKYKNDKQKLGQAQMELMRAHGANPMGGCWPMFLQLPVFFGLFRMLQYSVELRHAGFVAWITDLSQPDTITHIGSFSVNILPVLMVISWFVQQLTQPKPADPQQAQTQKMMLFMPVMFGFMLYNMPAGLTLYWLTSTFIGILEQRWIKHQIAEMESAGAFAAEEQEAAQVAVANKNARRGKRR